MKISTAVKLNAIQDIRAWTTEYAGPTSEIAAERALESGKSADEWRAAYDWIDDILILEQAKIQIDGQI